MQTFWRDFGFLFATTAIVALFSAASAALDPFSIMPLIVWGYVLPVALVMWAMFDARRRTATPCYDFGFLMYLCWYLSVPWYLIHTRGRAGWGVLALFFALGMAPVVVFTLSGVASFIGRTIGGM
jgi:hypothetical protein